MFHYNISIIPSAGFCVYQTGKMPFRKRDVHQHQVVKTRPVLWWICSRKKWENRKALPLQQDIGFLWSLHSTGWIPFKITWTNRIFGEVSLIPPCLQEIKLTLSIGALISNYFQLQDGADILPCMGFLWFGWLTYHHLPISGDGEPLWAVLHWSLPDSIL